MAEVIPFPIRSRTDLVRSMVDELASVHGDAANVFWRERIASIVSGMRSNGIAADTIRQEIYDLQDAIQREMQDRALETG